jgi:hypothetical protein
MPARLFASQLAAKVESEEGTKETLTASECILVSKVDYKPSIPTYARDVMRGSLSRSPGIGGAESAKISCSVELRGSGTAGVAPDYGVLLQGCGFGVVPTPTETPTSVVINPITDSIPSLTISAIYDGIVHTIIGARGTVKCSIEAGKPGKLDFEFTGAGIDVVDGALLDATYDSIIPPAFQDVSLLIDSYAAIISKLDFDIANEVVLREDMNAASGYLSALITGRNPKGSCDPELPAVATYDFYGKWKSDAVGAISLAAGATAGNIITISMPVVRYANITPGDRNGIRNLGIDYEVCADVNDDECVITLT